MEPLEKPINYANIFNYELDSLSRPGKLRIEVHSFLNYPSLFHARQCFSDFAITIVENGESVGHNRKSFYRTYRCYTYRYHKHTYYVNTEADLKGDKLCKFMKEYVKLVMLFHIIPDEFNGTNRCKRTSDPVNYDEVMQVRKQCTTEFHDFLRSDQVRYEF